MVVESRTTVESCADTWVAVTVSSASVTSAVTVTLEVSHSSLLLEGENLEEGEAEGDRVMAGFPDGVDTMLVWRVKKVDLADSKADEASVGVAAGLEAEDDA